MNFDLTEAQDEIVRQVRTLCASFPDEYWREHDRAVLNSIAEHVLGLPRSY